MNKFKWKDVQEDFSKTSLYRACELNNLKKVEHLLLNKSDPNIYNVHHAENQKFYYCPIHIAIELGHEKVVEKLIDYGAEPNKKYYDMWRCPYGYPPTDYPALYLACKKGRLNIVQILLDRGADINEKNSCNEGIFEIMAFDWKPDAFMYLIQNKEYVFDISELAQIIIKKALVWEEPGILKTVFDRINKIGPKCLLKHDIETILINNNHSEVSSALPLLHYCVFFNSQEAIDMLIDNNAEVNFKDRRGKTALHLALRYRRLGAVIGLIKNGIDVNVYCCKGYTPLDYIMKRRLYKKRYTSGIDIDDKVFADHISEENEALEDSKHSVRFYFIQNIVKMKILNFYVCEKNYAEVIKSKDPFQYQEDYQQELKEMRHRIVYGEINYYDVITASVNKMVNYLNNDVIMRKLDKERNYNFMFPHYADIIKGCFKKGLVRKKLMDQADELWIFKFLKQQLPYPCWRCIIDEFSNSEIQNVIYRHNFADKYPEQDNSKAQ